ncbi:MAG: rod shape-determining protein RodA [Caulobacterales bacterium]|jgi:rod shape determining protein RodA
MTTAAGYRSFGERLARLNWGLITVLCALACIGVVMHFSVTDGSWAGMPLAHASRFGLILILTLVLAIVDVRIWLAMAYPLYAVSLLLLVAVEVVGATRMGAQRWLDLGPVQLQPSEIMKIAIVLALARYYQGLLDSRRIKPDGLIALFVPLVMIGMPTALIMHQPDLGTALLVAGSGVGVMFLAGLKWRYIIPAGIAAVAAAVYAYFSVLQGYQRDRVNVFLGLENDPLGSGYHVLQSKIAIGAAGLLGHGYLKGPQSQLDFLPEKHTDFIFTMIVEEFGLVGAFVVLGLFGIALALTMTTALRSRTMFGRLAASGVAVTLGLYVFINTSMVIGLIPVVGIPLPLLSFGGTAMLTVMIGMSIVLSIHLHRETSISSRGVLW